MLAVALLAAFVAVERRTPQPLVRLGIFRSARSCGPTSARCACSAPTSASSSWPRCTCSDARLERARDRAGVPARRPARRVRRAAHGRGDQPLRHGQPIVASAVAFALGYALFLRVDATPYWITFLPTMLLIGVGFALGYAALNVQATAGVADHEQGLAAGLVQTSFQIGGAIVLAAVSAVVGRGDQRLPDRDRGRARRRGGEHRAGARRRGPAASRRGARYVERLTCRMGISAVPGAAS